MRCRELMERNVISCPPEATIGDVARLMHNHEIGIVPICDAAGHVLGTLTDRDLAVRVIAGGLAAETTLAKDVMSSAPITCHPDDEIAIAQTLMAQHKKGRILCVETDGRLVGLVSIADMAQVESEERTGRVFRAVTSRETAFILW